MATMDDVARIAGVSVTTVSHVLNGTRKVGPATLRAVQEAVQLSGYTPNVLARALARSTTNTIGVAMSAVSNHYFNDIVRAIENEAGLHQQMILLSDTRDDAAQEMRIVKALHERRVDGIILAPAADPDQKVLAYLEQSKMPAVLIDRIVSDKFDQVGVDSVQPMADIVLHLAGHGHQRIAFIAGLDGLSTSDERHAGYRLGLEQAGLAYDAALVRHGASAIEPARLAVHGLMAMAAAPTAIVSGNNLMTIGVMRALRELQLEVPDDIALVGFDDFDWADSFRPRLSVIDQPCESLGTLAVQLLIARINDPDGPRSTLRLNPKIKIRNSCGCKG